MSAERLAHALAALGLDGRVEARGALAVLTVRDAGAARDPALRRAAVSAAEREGFANLALEIEDADASAPLPRD